MFRKNPRTYLVPRPVPPLWKGFTSAANLPRSGREPCKPKLERKADAADEGLKTWFRAQHIQVEINLDPVECPQVHSLPVACSKRV